MVSLLEPVMVITLGVIVGFIVRGPVHAPAPAYRGRPEALNALGKATAMTHNRTSSTASASARGFTLIELLVVISILALLVAIILPAFGAAKLQARSTTSQARLTELDQAAEKYALDHRNVYPGQDNTVVPGRNPGDQDLKLADLPLLTGGTLTGSQLLACRLYGLYDDPSKPATFGQPLPADVRANTPRMTRPSWMTPPARPPASRSVSSTPSSRRSPCPSSTSRPGWARRT